MPALKQTVYLVTGANRGIGLGLVKSLSQRSDALIYATARDPKKADALNALAAERGNIQVVPLEVTSEASTEAAAKAIEEKSGKVDVIIANAGISEEGAYGPLLDQPLDAYRRHFEVNALGPVILVKAFVPLLNKSENPKFLLVSTGAASFGLAWPAPITPYTVSKAAVNFFALKVHQEVPNLTILALSPGLVQTDMGLFGANFLGVKDMSITVETSVDGIVKLADVSTRETHGGKFWDHTGEPIPW
ncbi:hypothetical protein JCM6882_003724 [Rhodosporidiobolus microsporus]